MVEPTQRVNGSPAPLTPDQQERLEVARKALRAVTEGIRRREAASVAESPTVREAGPGYAASLQPASLDGDRSATRADRLPVAPPVLRFPGPAAEHLPLRELEYAVVDIETTGGSAFLGHRMTEVAVVCIHGRGHVVGEYATLVNPFRPIPRAITRITNITDEMVEAAPPFRDVAEAVRRATAGRVFVAHNAGFDLRFLALELLRATGRPYERAALCTVRMARRLLPEVRRRNLDSVCDYFGIPIENRHRALGDARATARLLVRLLERAEDQSIGSWGMLEALLSRRTRRRRRSVLPRSMEQA